MDEILTININNIDEEHICCALGDKKSIAGVNKKKEWMKSRFNEGYVFKKLNVRGKVFIEYIPAEYAWAPIIAPNYTFISCFWVSGSFSGKGNGKRLLQECINDSKGKSGITAIAAKKKKPFLSDKSFYIKQGFEVVDSTDPYFELLALKFDKNADNPKFCNTVSAKADLGKGITLFYTYQCPFTEYYVKELENLCKLNELNCNIIEITSKEEAQAALNPFPQYSLYLDGNFITNHIINESAFKKMILPLL